MKSMIQFCKKEAVLSIAVVLALLSVFFVRPDAGYLAYIDFRTLGVLFCLMTIVAGLQQIGVFDRMAKELRLLDNRLQESNWTTDLIE